MKKIRLAIALVALVAMTAFAQSSAFGWIAVGKSYDSDKLLPAVNASKVSGNVVTAGSTTLAPLSEAIAEQFKKDGYTGQLTIDAIGSGAGLQRFTGTGDCDIANASRKISQAEIDAAKKIGRDPIEFRVAIDAIAVCVNKSNSFVTNLSKADLALAFSTATYWSDINASWPKKEILRYTPSTDNGTLDSFNEIVFAKKKEPILGAKNTQMNADPNLNAKGIENSPYAIGFFGYSYYMENKARLNILNIDGVEPITANIISDKYLLSRGLFMYTTAKIMRDKPQVAAFIDYYLTNVSKFTKRTGYFDEPADRLIAAKKLWLDSVKGLY